MMRQNAARSAEVYRQQQVMTATPEALTLMLYNGAIKFINESIEATKKKEYEKANTSCIKAQNIISEFRLTLKMEYEISKNLFNIIFDPNSMLILITQYAKAYIKILAISIVKFTF